MLDAWIAHRMEVVHIGSWSDLAERAGLSDRTIGELLHRGNLTPLNRTRRRWLAAALRVSVKRLEQLDDGDIEWIEDRDYCDHDSRTRRPPGADDDWDEPFEPEEIDDGTPVIARARANGDVDLDPDWNPWDGRRLPVKYAPGRDVYAIDLGGEAQSLVFRMAPPWEMGFDALSAVYVLTGFEEGRGYVARTRKCRSEGVVKLAFADGSSLQVPFDTVVRLGRLVGRWPKEAEAA